MKGLEALENIKREAGTPYFSTLYDIDMWREDFAIVETSLKALDTILNVLNNYINLINTEGKYMDYQMQKKFAHRLQDLLEELNV